MSYLDVASGNVVSELPGEQRAAFIRRTYGHLALAIAAFGLLEAQLIKMGFGEQMMAMLSTSKWSMLLVFGAFILASVVADKWARSDYSREMQYAGLGLYIVALAIFFLPLIFTAMRFAPNVLPNAALMTMALVAGLTMVVFTTKKDFSFLRPVVVIGSIIAVCLIVGSMYFGFNLGTFFMAAMIVFSSACILYSTSNVLHVYREDQHVAASLSLFASIGILFLYIVQFLMSFGSD